MFRARFVSCVFASVPLLAASIGAQPATAPVAGAVAPASATKAVTYKSVVLVSNRAGAEWDGKVRVLEDHLAAQLSELGFAVLTREVVVDSLRAFDPAVAALPRPADGLEAQLTEQSSALRLAQSLGVNYLIHASLASITATDVVAKAYGVETRSRERALRVSYRLVDASDGGSLTGDTVRVATVVRQTANAETRREGVEDDLLDEAAGRIVDSLRVRVAAGRVSARSAVAEKVMLTLRLEAADLLIPEVRLGPENTVAISESKYRLTPLNATVEIDGVAVGSAPGPLAVRPGFSRLRITREGFAPWERTINAVEGQTLSIALTLSDSGYARWKDATAFINALKDGARLTDAEVKVLEGYGRMLSESFSRMETKENVRLVIPGVRL
ncbi:MAG: PEGA domain-containing protein [Verrucomicrobia bacterium]|nr:PEGA domain-containing protein [Verrucomicrobiota bacterium]